MARRYFRQLEHYARPLLLNARHDVEVETTPATIHDFLHVAPDCFADCHWDAQLVTMSGWSTGHARAFGPNVALNAYA
jgi:hypothetical protein